MKRVVLNERLRVFVAKSEDEAYDFCAQTCTEEIAKAIASRASCSIALAGGNTPLRFYERLTEPSVSLLVNWSLLDVFWGDERPVAPDAPESNYGAAMEYFNRPPLDQAKKHRIVADCEDLEKSALEYEKLVKKVCSGARFDIALLGIGEDGHTASLFPNTAALEEEARLFVPVFVPEKNCWRISITFPAINQARSTYVLALGKTKTKALKQIFFGEPAYKACPAQKLGTAESPATFIIDRKAAYGLGL